MGEAPQLFLAMVRKGLSELGTPEREAQPVVERKQGKKIIIGPRTLERTWGTRLFAVLPAPLTQNPANAKNPALLGPRWLGPQRAKIKLTSVVEKAAADHL
jgi:hypothetical protein